MQEGYLKIILKRKKYDASMKKVFWFERGAHFAGNLKYTIWEMEDCMLFEGRSSNEFHDMRDYEFCFPKRKMKRIAVILKLTCGWKRRYATDDDILDGYGWNIEADFDGIHITTGGYEVYPFGYWVVTRMLQREMEVLCEKYAKDYTIKGRWERMKL